MRVKCFELMILPVFDLHEEVLLIKKMQENSNCKIDLHDKLHKNVALLHYCILGNHQL